MKRKDLKELAKAIATLQKIIDTSDNPEMVKKAKAKIFKATSLVDDPQDLFTLDEMVINFNISSS